MFSVKARKSLVSVLCLWGLLRAADPAPVWIDVPFVKQTGNGCGAASIAMVMQYWQHQQGRGFDLNADATRIQNLLYSDRAHGIYASAMERYLGQHAFRTFTFHGGWNDLEQHLTKGRPLIVALKPRSGADLHYVVVAGLDVGRQLVLVNDPAERKLLEQERSKFEREWKGADNWTLLAIPQQDVPSVR